MLVHLVPAVCSLGFLFYLGWRTGKESGYRDGTHDEQVRQIRKEREEG